MADLSDVAVALASLKPVGQWFLAHSVATMALAWLFHDQPFEQWPEPASWALYSWFVASMVLALFLVVSGIVSLIYEWRQSHPTGTEGEIPLAPRPKELEAPLAGEKNVAVGAASEPGGSERSQTTTRSG